MFLADHAKPIIFALDHSSVVEAFYDAKRAAGAPGLWGPKMNSLLHASGGPYFLIGECRKFGYEDFFADVKLHDIPETVARSVTQLRSAGATMITVHLSGGPEMVSAAVEAAGPDVRILGVTVLTSISSEVCEATYRSSSREQVRSLAAFIARSALRPPHGYVCSPHEVGFFATNPSFMETLRVIPGIRPVWFEEKGDQVRVGTPAQAMRDGATHLVMGRPLFKGGNGDIVQNLARTMEELRTA